MVVSNPYPNPNPNLKPPYIVIGQFLQHPWKLLTSIEQDEGMGR